LSSEAKTKNLDSPISQNTFRHDVSMCVMPAAIPDFYDCVEVIGSQWLDT